MKTEESPMTRPQVAQDIWKDALTKLTNALTSWRHIALAMTAINAALVIALIWQTQHIKIVPFIDKIDTQERVLWSGPAGSYTPDDLWTGVAVQRWLIMMRARPGNLQKPANLAVLNAHWEEAYNLTDFEASRAAAQYISEENPLKTKQPIEVRIIPETIQRYPHRPEDPPRVRVWHLEWSEDWILGSQTKRLKFSGDFWTELRPDIRKGQTEMVTQKEVDRKKPGLYIIKYSWAPLLTGGAS
jgi:type IV secretory pathway TrbF-like protein